ncbi:MAG TPA: thioredoxin-dependent thiol peroxidase [Xanthobacteraceae bacterium]|nr:thioredoxin-dependent thiol peroxidase [Xanthobacteraceae bacterium]
MGNPLSVGTPAPDFTLPRDGGGQVTLKDFSGRKVVLYFHPKADTPGCTKEAISFNALRKAFAEADTAILGVSADSVKAQDKFRDKYSLAFPLVSDETHRMLEAYGVWGEKSMYGKTFMGVERLTYLIDRQGRIAKVWPKVKVDGHAEEVLESAKLL